METTINEKVGAWLLVKGNSRDLLAERLGMTRPTLAGRIKGETEWTWNEVKIIAELTGASLDELV